MALMNKIIPFAIIGTCAAIVHLSIVMLLVHEFQFLPLAANVFGFLVAFQISYWGHRKWTFSETTVQHQVALPRLFLLQTFNFAANEFFFYILLSLNLPYPLALIIVLLILPFLTFTLSRFWVFKTA